MMLRAFENRLSRRYFSIFQVNTVSALVMLESSLRHASGDRIARGCTWGLLGLGESRPGLVGLYVFFPFSILVTRLGADFLFFFYLLFSPPPPPPPPPPPSFWSAYRIARGQEETSTSQQGRKRGPTQGMPSTSNIISSLSMEELRAYCQIPDENSQ